MKTIWILLSQIFVFLLLGCVTNENNKIPSESSNEIGSVLPFPIPKSASVTNETLAESKHIRRAQAAHLPEDAPNILIVLMDDVGFGTASTFGGGINTPTFTKVYNEGIAYNNFILRPSVRQREHHCSPAVTIPG